MEGTEVVPGSTNRVHFHLPSSNETKPKRASKVSFVAEDIDRQRFASIAYYESEYFSDVPTKTESDNDSRTITVIRRAAQTAMHKKGTVIKRKHDYFDCLSAIGFICFFLTVLGMGMYAAFSI